MHAKRIFALLVSYKLQSAERRYNIVTMIGFATYRRRIGPILAVTIATVLNIAGCAPEVNVRGHVLNPDSLAQIKPGLQTRDQVLDLLGSPSSIGTFEDTRWYYISRRTEHLAFYEPEVMEAHVVMVEFDTAGFVKDVAHLPDEDIREVEIVERKTPTKGRELGFLQQILGNIGMRAVSE